MNFWKCAVQAVVLLYGIKAQNVLCPTGSTHYMGWCYQFVNTEKTWISARQHCRQLAANTGKLVTVNSADVQRWIAERISALGWTNNGVWIGLHDRITEGRFYWDDAVSDVQATYFNWNPGEPGRSITNQDCAYMRRQYGWRWVDVECSSFHRTYNFVCQYRGILMTTLTPPARKTATTVTSGASTARVLGSTRQGTQFQSDVSRLITSLEVAITASASVKHVETTIRYAHATQIPTVHLWSQAHELERAVSTSAVILPTTDDLPGLVSTSVAGMQTTHRKVYSFPPSTASSQTPASFYFTMPVHSGYVSMFSGTTETVLSTDIVTPERRETAVGSVASRQTQQAYQETAVSTLDVPQVVSGHIGTTMSNLPLASEITHPWIVPTDETVGWMQETSQGMASMKDTQQTPEIIDAVTLTLSDCMQMLPDTAGSTSVSADCMQTVERCDTSTPALHTISQNMGSGSKAIEEIWKTSENMEAMSEHSMQASPDEYRGTPATGAEGSAIWATASSIEVAGTTDEHLTQTEVVPFFEDRYTLQGDQDSPTVSGTAVIMTPAQVSSETSHFLHTVSQSDDMPTSAALEPLSTHWTRSELSLRSATPFHYLETSKDEEGVPNQVSTSSAWGPNDATKLGVTTASLQQKFNTTLRFWLASTQSAATMPAISVTTASSAVVSPAMPLLTSAAAMPAATTSVVIVPDATTQSSTLASSSSRASTSLVLPTQPSDDAVGQHSSPPLLVDVDNDLDKAQAFDGHSSAQEASQASELSPNMVIAIAVAVPLTILITVALAVLTMLQQKNYGRLPFFRDKANFESHFRGTENPLYVPDCD